MSEAEKIAAFSTFIQRVEGGQLHADLSRELPEVMAKLSNHVRDHGGSAAGKIKIEFAFTLKDGVIEVTGNFDVTTPKDKRGRSLFWLTPENNLTERNPKQGDLPFRDVNRGGGIRTA